MLTDGDCTQLGEYFIMYVTIQSLFIFETKVLDVNYTLIKTKKINIERRKRRRQEIHEEEGNQKGAYISR